MRPVVVPPSLPAQRPQSYDRETDSRTTLSGPSHPKYEKTQNVELIETRGPHRPDNIVGRGLSSPDCPQTSYGPFNGRLRAGSEFPLCQGGSCRNARMLPYKIDSCRSTMSSNALPNPYNSHFEGGGCCEANSVSSPPLSCWPRAAQELDSSLNVPLFGSGRDFQHVRRYSPPASSVQKLHKARAPSMTTD